MSFDIAHGLAGLVTKCQMRTKDVRQEQRIVIRVEVRCRRTFWSAHKLIRTSLGFLLLSCAASLVPSSPAQQSRETEYRAKANFLAAFPNFIEWPADAFSSEQAPLLICIFGDFSFGTSLAEITRGASIRRRRVEIRWVRKEQELRTCQIVFVSRSEEKRYGKILKVLQGASVLTVGETSDFLASGGTIEFLVAGDKLQFEVNLGAANEARLRISSNMLALARHVVTKTEAAKS